MSQYTDVGTALIAVGSITILVTSNALDRLFGSTSLESKERNLKLASFLTGPVTFPMILLGAYIQVRAEKQT